MAGYNYEVFSLEEAEPEFLAFRSGLHVSERAPSFPLEHAVTGETVAMRSLWANGPAVLEFGSFT